MRPFFSEVLLAGESRGVYIRRAKVAEGEMKRLAAHRFAVRTAGDRDFYSFEIDLGNHEISKVRGELLGDRTGSLTFTDAATGEQREILFENDEVIHDSRLVTKSETFYMGCFIDTPAYDTFTANQCFRLGSQPSTVSFKVFLPYTPEYVVWSNPSSSCSGLTCSVPISPGQTVNGYAYWVINGIPTGPVAATAYYVYEPLL